MLVKTIHSLLESLSGRDLFIASTYAADSIWADLSEGLRNITIHRLSIQPVDESKIPLAVSSDDEEILLNILWSYAKYLEGEETSKEFLGDYRGGIFYERTEHD